MHVSVNPDPCAAGSSYQIAVANATPPYTYALVPPVPPGTTVDSSGKVQVPADAPPGTLIDVEVTDSSRPPQSAIAHNSVEIPIPPPAYS